MKRPMAWGIAFFDLSGGQFPESLRKNWPV